MSDHVAITTLRRPSRLLFPGTNPNLTNGPTSTVQVSTTPPVTSGSVGVVAGPLNYMRILPLLESGTTSPYVRVTGWTFVQNLDRWAPHILAEYSITPTGTGTSISVNGTNLLPPYVLTQNMGDAKVWTGLTATDTVNAWMVVDTCGMDLVQIELYHGAATAKKCNAIIGEF